jgi:hypothetical protein
MDFAASLMITDDVYVWEFVDQINPELEDIVEQRLNFS